MSHVSDDYENLSSRRIGPISDWVGEWIGRPNKHVTICILDFDPFFLSTNLSAYVTRRSVVQCCCTSISLLFDFEPLLFRGHLDNWRLKVCSTSQILIKSKRSSTTRHPYPSLASTIQVLKSHIPSATRLTFSASCKLQRIQFSLPRHQTQGLATDQTHPPTNQSTNQQIQTKTDVPKHLNRINPPRILISHQIRLSGAKLFCL